MLDRKFQKAEEEYYRLKEIARVKSMSPDQFNSSLEELMVEHDGRYWMIGAQTGKWHVNDGQNWIEAEPPQVDEDASYSGFQTGPGFEVILQGFNEMKKISVIKVTREAREATGSLPTDLSYVKRLIESAPTSVCNCITIDEANEIKRNLEQAGAAVEIRPT